MLQEVGAGPTRTEHQPAALGLSQPVAEPSRAPIVLGAHPMGDGELLATGQTRGGGHVAVSRQERPRDGLTDLQVLGEAEQRIAGERGIAKARRQLVEPSEGGADVGVTVAKSRDHRRPDLAQDFGLGSVALVAARLQLQEPQRAAEVRDGLDVGVSGSRNQTRLAPRGERPRHVAGALQVMGKTLGLGTTTAADALFDRSGDPFVQQPPPVLRQTLIGGVLDQRVLELVADVRRRAEGADQAEPQSAARSRSRASSLAPIAARSW